VQSGKGTAAAHESTALPEKSNKLKSSGGPFSRMGEDILKRKITCMKRDLYLLEKTKDLPRTLRIQKEAGVNNHYGVCNQKKGTPKLDLEGGKIIKHAFRLSTKETICSLYSKRQYKPLWFYCAARDGSQMGGKPGCSPSPSGLIPTSKQ